jgi:hypothetical protein
MTPEIGKSEALSRPITNEAIFWLKLVRTETH